MPSSVHAHIHLQCTYTCTPIYSIFEYEFTRVSLMPGFKLPFFFGTWEHDLCLRKKKTEKVGAFSVDVLYFAA